MFIMLDQEDGNTFTALLIGLNLFDSISKLFTSVNEVKDYIHMHSLENDSFLIHGSIGRSHVGFDKHAYADEVYELTELIHNKNPFSRITVFSGADKFPLATTITDMKADGFIKHAITLNAYIKLATRDNLTQDELNFRGKSIENIETGERYGANERRFRIQKENE
jgi:hypothetical protein